MSSAHSETSKKIVLAAHNSRRRVIRERLNYGILHPMRRLLFSCLLTAAAFGQTVPSGPSAAPVRGQNSTILSVPHFEDIAQQAGLTISHISSPAARYIIESVS